MNWQSGIESPHESGGFRFIHDRWHTNCLLVRGARKRREEGSQRDMCKEFIVRVELVESPGPDEMRVSPRMARLLERAAEIGRKHTGKPLVGTETVLRALAEEPDGIAGQVLDELGVRTKTRRRLDEILSDPKYSSTGTSRTTP